MLRWVQGLAALPCCRALASRLRHQLAKLDLLLLDELGYVPTSKTGAELLFDVIVTAYERSSLLVTTNLPFVIWTEVLGSERLTGAALDRLTPAAPKKRTPLETKGNSDRQQDAKRRREPVDDSRSAPRVSSQARRCPQPPHSQSHPEPISSIPSGPVPPFPPD